MIWSIHRADRIDHGGFQRMEFGGDFTHGPAPAMTSSTAEPPDISRDILVEIADGYAFFRRDLTFVRCSSP